MATTKPATKPASPAESPTEVSEATPLEAPSETKPSTTKKFRKKKVKRAVVHGHIYVKTSFNNTLISVCDQTGNVLLTTSSGACGFRGSKKGVAYAAQIAADKIAGLAQNQYGMKQIDIFIKGIGQGRDATVRSLIGKQFKIESITDSTKVPHGGPRPRKARRV